MEHVLRRPVATIDSSRTPRMARREMKPERTHVEVIPHDYSYVFNPYREPIAEVNPGDQVVIHCNDAFESRIQSESDIPGEALATAKFLNPQSGPIYISGAKPGDTLLSPHQEDRGDS